MQAQGQRNLARSTPFSKKQVHCQCVGSFLFHLILFNFLKRQPFAYQKGMEIGAVADHAAIKAKEEAKE